MSCFQFDKNHRLLNAADFSGVFDKAPLKVSVPELLILAKPNQREVPRVGLVVAKKHVKFAVGRNRIKRVARESFRLNQLQLNGLDIVVLARKGIAGMDRTSLRQTLDQLWVELAKKAARKGLITSVPT